MATTSLSSGQASLRTGGLLRRAWAFNWPLTLTVLINLALVPIVVVAMLVDPKVITGVNGWIKPFKFTVSAAVYAATFLWLLTLVQGRRRWVQAAANVTAFALMVEIVLIIMQVVRGTTSHFNIGTPLDAAVFTTMGALITLVAIFDLMVGIWLIFQRMPDPVLAWSVRLGVLLSFMGMLVGYIMTSGPNAAQLAAAQAGLPLTVVGAHSVGVADGGPGLPLLGWSTIGGDLRIGHFVGLHAMQVLPLLGFVLTRAWATRRWSLRQRTQLIWLAGAGYLGATVLVTWQALRGQSLIAPDAVTLGALGLGLAAGVVLTLAILWSGRSAAGPAITTR
ncbi:MAG: hypothetical protein U0X20_29650 [Caldilineaceae bacterium]